MESHPPSNVTYVDDALAKLLDTLAQLQLLVHKRVISSSRGALTMRIQDAVTQTEQVRELLTRAKLGNRLGFIRQNGGIQPVMAASSKAVNDAE